MPGFQFARRVQRECVCSTEKTKNSISNKGKCVIETRGTNKEWRQKAMKAGKGLTAWVEMGARDVEREGSAMMT